MAQRQLNIRIEREQFEVLVAAANLDDEHPPDLLRPLLDELLAKLEADPDVMELLEKKRARGKAKQAERAQPVASLAEKRRKSSGRDA